MAESVGTIYYDVDANLDPLLGKMRQAEDALGGLGKGMGKVDGSARQMQQEFDKTERSANRLGGELNGLTRVIRGVVAAMALREAAQWVQQYQTMAERVRMATESLDEFEMVQRRLQATADGTYRALSEAQELYIRTADSLRAMGYETAQALDVTDSMSYAFVTNATSADRAAAATSAFSKSMNTGKVAADQWETITSAIPSVINDIAAASNRTAAEVRALGAAGKLTARDLSEGLRKALDENKAAADGMATDLVDASVRVRNAITVTLVVMEEQTGALQSVTDGIITAAEALLAFGQDAEKMEAFLDAVTVAATSTAAVIAGRLLTAMGASTAAMYQNTIGARAKAAAELQAAQAAAALSAQNLIQAQTAERAARGLSTHAAAAASLAVAEDAATAATTRLTTAQAAMAGSFRVSTAAANGLRAAMSFLGGPTGVILIAAAALATWHRRTQEARNSTLELSSSVQGLTAEMRELEKIENAKRIEEETRSLERQNRALQNNARLRPHADRGEAATRAFEEEMLRRRVAIQKTEERIAALQKRQQQLANANIPRPRSSTPGEPSGAGGGGGGGGSTELSEFQKLEQSLRNQIELAKRTGLARAELAALQRLGADATDEERARITELVGELHQLEEATKAAEKAEAERLKSSEEARRAAEDNADVLAGLREQLYQTTLNAEELAMRQAELALNSYATPDQVAEVRALASELFHAQQAAAELERRRSAFGTDAAGAIRGQVSPLSGGAFDDQAARYEAEAAAEQERYAAQLARLQEAKELVIEVVGGYYALEEQMAQEHAARMAQIERARNQVKLQSGQQSCGAMADIMNTAFGEQSGLYKAAFAAQKAFAIAQSIMAIQQGIAMAAANPWPINLAAMASVAAATAGLVSNIASVTMAGGRIAGGPVQAGRAYRVNENGAPEVYSAANGQQYMIPNKRGEVISNRDATSGGGVVINIHNAPPGTTAEQSTGQDGVDVIDVWIADFMADGRTAGAVQGKFGLQPHGR